MTRTEQDLRALLTLPVEPESLHRVEQTLHRRASRPHAHPAAVRRPWLLPATAAAGVAVVVLATVLGVGAVRDRLQQPTTVSPLPTLRQPRPTSPATSSSR